MGDVSAQGSSAGSPGHASPTTEILRHVGEGIALVRASDGLIVFANPAFERMFKYPPGELVGRYVSALNSPEGADPDHVAAEIIAALRAHGHWEGELRNRRKDGTDLWCHASVSTFDHPELGPVWITIHRDVSERRRLEEALVRANAFLDSIVENIPDMVFVKDAKDLRFVLFNRAGEELLGYDRAALIGKTDHDFFPKAEADFFNAVDRAALSDKALRDVTEEPIATAVHGMRLLHTKKIPILDEKGEPVYLLGISEDVTERRHAEQLRARHERTTSALNIILSALHTHVDVTAAFREVCMGLRELAECAGATLALFDERGEWVRFVAADAPWPPGIGPDAHLPIAEYPGGAEILAGNAYAVRDLDEIAHFPVARYRHMVGFRSTLSLPLYTGQEVIGFLTLHWNEVGGCATVDTEVLGQATSALAIALERHRLFEQVRAGRERLAALSRRLLTVQESERRHLARELHDEIGQYLTGVALQLSQLEGRPAEEFRARLGELGALVTDLIDRVRDLSLDLRPAMLDDFGLLPALRWVFDRFSRQTGIAVAFTQVGLERRFSPDVETAAYRIVQEALTNVARHAGVARVAVDASASDRGLRVVVADDGSGFDADAALASGNASGLSGMRERMALLGGRLSIESRPGGGTRVRAEFDGP